jgi:hypothetical protein
MAHTLTNEERAKGGKRKLETLSPQKRQSIATMAVMVREAKRKGWDPYAVNATDLDHINEKLFKLECLEAAAWAEGDWDKVAMRISQSFPWFAKKVQLTWMMAARRGPAVDIDDTTSKRLEEARERREKAQKEEEAK